MSACLPPPLSIASPSPLTLSLSLSPSPLTLSITPSPLTLALSPQILEDPAAARYVDGIAIHWYRDDVIGPSVMDETQPLFPDRFLLYTEACDGELVVMWPGRRLGCGGVVGEVGLMRLGKRL